MAQRLFKHFPKVLIVWCLAAITAERRVLLRMKAATAFCTS